MGSASCIGLYGGRFQTVRFPDVRKMDLCTDMCDYGFDHYGKALSASVGRALLCGEGRKM